MNAGSSLSAYTIPLIVAALVGIPFLGLVVFGIVQTRRRDRTWQRVGRELDLGGRSSVFRRPRLHGIYRGREIRAAHEGGFLRVRVRSANHAHLLDEIRSSAPLPDPPWLTARARGELEDLARAGRRWWKVRVQDHLVTLTCLWTETDARSLRNLLDLTVDLAEGVDAVASLPVLPEEPPPAAPTPRIRLSQY